MALIMDTTLSDAIEIIEDLGHTHKFCTQLHDTISRAKEKNKPVLYSCSNHPHHRANGAVMICAYMIFVHNCTAERAYGPFMGISPPFITFRDAGFCINTFPITVLDCTRAIRRACSLNHFNFKTFSVVHFQALAKLQNGDLSWIVPGKFLAFSGPLTKRRQLSPGVYSLTPEGYVPVLKKLGVSCIVRFNSKCYDRNVFLVNGIRHVDLYYEDGGNPTEEILQAFLHLCENERGAIAVHCKAGLGRTGTNIAAYMMKHYSYTARETMAWCRLCRPGSIVGPQQQYLASIEQRMFREGIDYRLKHRLPAPAPAGDERSLASASGSTDGVLSTYTGVSVNGAASVGGLSASGLGHSHGHSRNSHGHSHGHSGNSETQRVMTPPLIGQHSNRSKQPTESLFRNAVSGSKPKDNNSGDGSGLENTNNQMSGQKSTYQYTQQQQNAGGANVNTIESDMRRPSTSGGILSKSSNTSPLRGQAEKHSTSFTYGNPAAAHQQQQLQAAMRVATTTATNSSSNNGLTQHGSGYGYRTSSHAGTQVIDHDAGPGKININSDVSGLGRSSGGGSAYRPITPHSPNPYTASAGNPVGSPSNPSPSSAGAGRRSISTSRYSPTNNPSSPSGINKVEFYDSGRNVTSAGNGALPSPDRLRLSTNLSSPSPQQQQQQVSHRPGTSGGLRYSTNPGSSSGGGYSSQQQQATSPYLTRPSGGQQQQPGTTGLRLQDYAYESNGSGGAYASSGSGNALTLSRPRTSGGALAGGGGQGRSVSSGRAGTAKRRY